MKLILKIAKNELRNLFYSPVAWLTLLVFFVIASLTYCNSLYSMANTQEVMIRNSNPGWNWLPNSLTSGLFTDLYKNAASYLYLFIPLLTMGLISRERNEDTMRLLFSSPVTTRQVVLGKYLGIVGYLLLLVAVIMLFMVLGFLIYVMLITDYFFPVLWAFTCWYVPTQPSGFTCLRCPYILLFRA